MPYTNVPKRLWGKMDRCVAKIMARDKVSKPKAIARCHSSIVGKELEMSNARKKRKKKSIERKAALAVAEEPLADQELEEITDEEAQKRLEAYAMNEEKEELPMGGAQTWEQRDEFVEAEATVIEEKQAKSEFRTMVDNILDDASLEIEEKGSKIAMLAEGFCKQPEVEEVESEPDTSIVDKVLSIIGIKRDGKKAPKVQTKGQSSGLIVEKDLKGNHRWFGWVSNKFRDRDVKSHPKGEIISEAAHKEFVNWVYEKAEIRMPQLWLWHTPKTAMEKRADWLDYSDGFLLASGLLTEKEAEMWTQLLEKHEMGMSHGFFKSPQHYDAKNGVINKYRLFEGSGLPLAFVANEWTDFTTLLQEAKEMGFTPDRRAFLVDALGEEKVAELEASTKDLAEELKELGVEFKEAEEEKVVVEEKTTLEKPVESEATEADVKEILESLGIDKLSEYLEGQDTLINEIKTAVETQAKTIADLQKSDDEKVAEALKPKVDVKEDIMPVWLRKASQSDENLLTEEDAKTISDKSGAAWVSEALGIGSDPGASVPM